MKHIKDENGAYMDCYAYPHSKIGKHECKILEGWYNPYTSRDRGNCDGCPFFKTQAQAAEDAEKYPVQGKYKKRG